MFRSKIYIPKEVKEYYSHYGDLDMVTNALIDIANEQELWPSIATEDMPADRASCTSVTLTVDNVTYEECRRMAGARSKQFSLHRLLMYGYYNELLADMETCIPWQDRQDPLLLRLRTLYADMCDLAILSNRENAPWSEALEQAISLVGGYAVDRA